MKGSIRAVFAVAMVLLLTLPARAQEHILVDRSQNGRYAIYYMSEGREWSVRDTATGRSVDLGAGTIHTNCVFFGDLVARYDAYTTDAYWQLLDPATGEAAEIAFEPASPGRYVPRWEEATIRDRVLGLGWHAASQQFVRLTITMEDTGNEDNRLWLDFYDIDGALVKRMPTPFEQGFYFFGGEIYTEYNNLHIWGDYAVFYHFPGTKHPYRLEREEDEKVVFFSLNDGTYWFAEADMWRAARDRIVLISYDRDDAGSVQALQVEVYVDGECVDALWQPRSYAEGGNIIAYSYPENKLFFNSLVFDFANHEVRSEQTP